MAVRGIRSVSNSMRSIMCSILGQWKVLRCSFCGKSEKDVRKLVAGPAAHICEECVDLCIDLLGEELSKKPQSCSLAV